MAPEHLVEAERLLRKGANLGAVCETLGVTRRTLERCWRAEHGTSPARWRRKHAPRSARAGSPVLAFRFARKPELADVASAVGLTPEQWARAALEAVLDTRIGGATTS
jgi:hypothetical protein